MANKKITDLVEITSAANADVLPIVDVSVDITNKIKVENLPISTATQTALDAKQETLVSGTNIKTINSTSILGSGDVAVQPTLVSGTNIKTINSTSLLGSGDIAIAANPAGTAGQIQFSDGSAFAADSNLYWDNTNKRLGVGTSSPSASIQCTTFTSTSITDNGTTINLSPSYNVFTTRNVAIGAGDLPARLGIKGSGSTSATTSLLVQNSSGTELFKVTDDGIALMRRINYGSSASEGQLRFGDSFLVYNTSGTASLSSSSAGFEVQSTTKGFLPPRMTTTQKNAISSPAEGLMVMDITTHKLCVYDGTSWVDLH